MSDVFTDTEQRIYNQFVDTRLELQADLSNLTQCAGRLQEMLKHGKRLGERDMEALGTYATSVQLTQGRLSLLQELVDAMGLV